MLIPISEDNCQLFDLLVQKYEEEFASLTGKKKNSEGKYELDSDWKEPNQGFYWKEDSQVKGFCVKTTVEGRSDISEFYIVPKDRKKGIGRKFAFAVFDAFPGKWQVRQIQGAEDAKKFWRRIIGQYTDDNYIESEEKDPTFGIVTCQKFSSKL